MGSCEVLPCGSELDFEVLSPKIMDDELNLECFSWISLDLNSDLNDESGAECEDRLEDLDLVRVSLFSERNPCEIDGHLISEV